MPRPPSLPPVEKQRIVLSVLPGELPPEGRPQDLGLDELDQVAAITRAEGAPARLARLALT